MAEDVGSSPIVTPMSKEVGLFSDVFDRKTGTEVFGSWAGLKNRSSLFMGL
jgi:hypothetical protein